MRWLGLVVIGSFIGGCAASDGAEASAAGGSDVSMTLASTTKLGVYLVDGTMTDEASNGVIHQLSERASADVKSVHYYAGPDLACLECDAKVRAVTRDICDDLARGTTNMFAVFGYSRGVFISNAAATEAAKRCSPRAPLPAATALSFSSSYVYGGFLDAVDMSPSSLLNGANWVGPTTMFRHVHRANTTDTTLTPVTNLGGGAPGSANLVGPDLAHVDMGFSAANLDRMIEEANGHSGFRIFY